MKIVYYVDANQSDEKSWLTSKLIQADHGAEVCVFAPSQNKLSSIKIPEGVKKYILKRNLKNFFLSDMKRLQRAMQEIKPDVIVVMSGALKVLNTLSEAKYQVIAWADEENLTLPASKAALYEKYVRLIVPNNYLLNWYQEHFPNIRVSLINEPIRLEFPKGDKIKDTTKRLKHRLLCVGKLESSKRFDLLITAFSQVCDIIKDWELVIVGEGAEKTRLQAHIQSLELNDRVFLVGEADNIVQWYESADIYLLAAMNEGISRSLLDAMSFGLPSIVVKSDMGASEIVRHGVDGFIVPAEADVIAQRMAELMVNEELRQAMSVRAKDVCDRYSEHRSRMLWRHLLDTIKKEV
ncbi:glycosyltransferase [Basilea psittacipulmonis]|uniref:glycosyltransferase n=1 Tax=Basilea psittacipulmonis TaxID=1472345 RepID=UPI00068C18AA|nr:glycosyltransferase [Basilea psittacipulmonis]